MWYLGMTITNLNGIHNEIKNIFTFGDCLLSFNLESFASPFPM